MKVLVPLANGFEEGEAILPVDMIRRAGIEVVVAGLDSSIINGAHKIVIQTDCILADAGIDYDAVFLPGGMPGSENLANSDLLKTIVQKLDSEGKLVSAICAAPAVALERFGVIRDRKFTCYPGFEDRVKDGVYTDSEIVIDGNLLTAKGVGYAHAFGIALVRELAGDEMADNIAQGTFL